MYAMYQNSMFLNRGRRVYWVYCDSGAGPANEKKRRRGGKATNPRIKASNVRGCLSMAQKGGLKRPAATLDGMARLAFAQKTRDSAASKKYHS